MTKAIACLVACAASACLLCADAEPATVIVDLKKDWQSQYDDLNEQLEKRSWFKSVADQAFRRDALILDTDRSPSDVVLRRSEALLNHLAPELKPSVHAGFASDLKALRRRAVAAKDDLRFFTDICRLRRKITFANPLLDFDRIVFLKSRFSRFQHCCYQYYGNAAVAGGGVYALSDPFGERPRVRDVLAVSTVVQGRLAGRKLDPGSFLSLSLSYDASTVYFAYVQCDEPSGQSVKGAKSKRIQRGETGEKWSPERCWHVFKASVDGSRLEQLTDGPWNEFDPWPLPNGRLVFLSERRGGFGRCHGTAMPIYTLHSMRADGSDIVPLSYHETNEWHPSVDNNGMIIYTRWDYVDRGDCIAHHPWITYPDGRDPRAIQGNYPTARRGRPDMELHVRAIPGSHRYVSTAAGHHRLAYGSLIVLDPRVGDDDAMSPVRRLTPDTRFPESEENVRDRELRRRDTYRYGTAWPLSETTYLAVHAPNGAESLGIYVIDAFGNRELLYRDPDIHCTHPIPLRVRPVPPVIPHATAVGLPESIPPRGGDQEAGTVACVNVYASQRPWPQGTKIKRLRVIQLFPKATYRKDSPMIGVASESLARGVLGTAPVEEDGSVYFSVPSGKALYFQALDEKGLAVQSMMSATYVHPGEHLTCQGCHEPRAGAPPQPSQAPLAFRRPPSRLAPDVDGSHPVSFPRLVQPVLDKQCVPCHEKNKAKKAPDLTGGPTKFGWSRAFASLTRYAPALSGKPPDRQPVRTTPGRFGARASKLYRQLTKGHHKLELPAQDLHRIALWLDCNSNFFGAYHDVTAQLQGELIMSPLE